MFPMLGKCPFDFVLVAFNETSKAKYEQIRETYFTNIKSKGLQILSPVFSLDQKIIFWRIHAKLETLYEVAEELNENLPTVQNDVYRHDTWYNHNAPWKRLKCWWNKVDPFKLPSSEDSSDIDTHFFSSRFNKRRLSQFLHGDDPNKLFPQSLRSKLVSYILENTKFTDDCTDIGISHLKTMGVFTAAYPCHDEPLNKNINIKDAVPSNDRQILSIEWASFRCIFKYQPIEIIKRYFGIKIAFYFKWIGFYTVCLIPASIVGILCILYGALSILGDETLDEICYPNEGNDYVMCPLCDKFCSYYSLKEFTCFYGRITHVFDNSATPFFAVFMSLWSVIYLELWKRRQCKLVYDWHIMDYVDDEIVRPEYAMSARKTKKNLVTGKMEPITSKAKHALKIASTFSVVFFFVFLVIASVFGVMAYRAAMFSIQYLHDSSSSFSKLFVTVTAATLNLVFINILSFGYYRLAIIMTEWENPRTQSDYEDSFTLKLFWFQFCNTYASLFYVSFFKSEFFTGWPGNYKRMAEHRFRYEGCSDQGCFLELCIQIVIIMVGEQFLGNIVEIGWPYVKRKYKAWRSKLLHTLPVPIWETDYQLSDKELLSLVEEYQEVVLQYGFVTLFVAAFPLAPLIALCTNVIEIRIDAINMVDAFRRPVASISKGIGIWYEILATVTNFSVLVNGFVLSFASEFIPRLVYKYQYSSDGSMKGYINWSLSHYNVSDFKAFEKPENNIGFENLTWCRYPGHHQRESPYDYNSTHYKILSLRLLFAFIFQWIITATMRIVAWIIPDRPKSIELSMKRETFLNREALRVNKVSIKTIVEE